MTTGSTEEHYLPVNDRSSWNQHIYFPPTREELIERAKTPSFNIVGDNRERRVYTIPIGEIKPEEVEEFIKKIRKYITRNPNE